jgi:hypothetical protein
MRRRRKTKAGNTEGRKTIRRCNWKIGRIDESEED